MRFFLGMYSNVNKDSISQKLNNFFILIFDIVKTDLVLMLFNFFNYIIFLIHEFYFSESQSNLMYYGEC